MKRIKSIVSVALLLVGQSVWAASIPLDLKITATVAVDTVNSLAAAGGASQSGSISLIQGGSTSSEAFGNDPAGTPSLSGLLSDTGDGLSSSVLQAGSGIGALTDGLFVDYSFNLLNTGSSAYTVSFRALFRNVPSASGDDAFAQAQVEILDSALNILLFNDEERDTLNGNFSGGGAGGTFFFVVNPGDSLSFSALMSVRGGSFSDNGAYANDIAADILVDSIRGGPTNPMPVPGSLALLAVAALGALLQRSRRPT